MGPPADAMYAFEINSVDYFFNICIFVNNRDVFVLLQIIELD